MAKAQRQIEQRANAILKGAIAHDLAADVPDDAAKPGAQEFELPPGALELMGTRVAPHHDGGAPCHPQIAQAQLNAFTFGQFGQLFDRAVGEPRIGRMRNRLLLRIGYYRLSG